MSSAGVRRPSGIERLVFNREVPGSNPTRVPPSPALGTLNQVCWTTVCEKTLACHKTDAKLPCVRTSCCRRTKATLRGEASAPPRPGGTAGRARPRARGARGSIPRASWAAGASASSQAWRRYFSLRCTANVSLGFCV